MTQISRTLQVYKLSRDELLEITPTPDRGVKISTPTSNLDPTATTVKFSIDTSPPRRVQLAPPTITQGEEGYQKHEIGRPLCSSVVRASVESWDRLLKRAITTSSHLQACQSVYKPKEKELATKSMPSRIIFCLMTF